MRRLMFGASALVCGLLNMISSVSGCSEVPPRPTPEPPLPNGCTAVGTCNSDGPTDDDNPCTNDVCDECGQTVHRPTIDEFPCGGGTQCSLPPHCKNGSCVQLMRPDGIACFSADPCVPQGVCMAGDCMIPPPLVCNVDEFCSLGECIKECLGTPWSVAIPSNSSGLLMVTGDFNGDNRPDIAVINAAWNAVDLLLSNGDGSFSAVEFNVGPAPTSIVAADLNGDGTTDMAVTSMEWKSVTVMLNDGNGAFSPNGLYPLGVEPRSIKATDLNGDGKADLVVGGPDDITHVLLNQGNGAFGPKVSYDGGNAIAFADLNGDTYVDLAVTSPLTGSISTLINKGDGTFYAKTVTVMALTSTAVAAADFDGDGRVDLVATKFNEHRLLLLRNNGDGSFDTTTELSTGLHPIDVVAADMNADGHVDLAVINQGDSSLDLFLNEGNGTFMKPLNVQISGIFPSSIVAEDMNGDGKPDLAVAHSGNTVSIYLNDCLLGP